MAIRARHELIIAIADATVEIGRFAIFCIIIIKIFEIVDSMQ